MARSAPPPQADGSLPGRLARLASLYAAAALPCLLLVLLVMCWPQAGGRRDLSGATFGHDFSQVWVAGRTALSGHSAAVYDDGLHDRAQTSTFGPGAALFAWHYPPAYLILAAGLALLPYAAAVLLWGFASVALIFSVLRTILGDRRAALVGLALPPVFLCLSYGQNGLMTASLLGYGLVLAGRRPWVAGAVIGLVCYKPQLVGLVPIVMLLDGNWRVAVGAATSALALSALALALFGPAPYVAFLHGLGGADADIFRQGWAGFALNAGIFGAARLLGAPVATALAAQAAVALATVAVTLRIRRSSADAHLRNAVLLAAIPLVSPYVPVYDLAILVPAGAFFLAGAMRRDGLRPGECLALMPLLAIAFDPRSLAAATHVPFGSLLCLGTFALVANCARRVVDRSGPGRASIVEPVRATTWSEQDAGLIGV